MFRFDSRLQLLEEEDDGLTCRMCLQPFWYKSQLHDHLKSTHSISEPGNDKKHSHSSFSDVHQFVLQTIDKEFSKIVLKV